jgi:hypothetical protein
LYAEDKERIRKRIIKKVWAMKMEEKCKEAKWITMVIKYMNQMHNHAKILSLSLFFLILSQICETFNFPKVSLNYFVAS